MLPEEPRFGPLRSESLDLAPVLTLIDESLEELAAGLRLHAESSTRMGVITHRELELIEKRWAREWQPRVFAALYDTDPTFEAFGTYLIPRYTGEEGERIYHYEYSSLAKAAQAVTGENYSHFLAGGNSNRLSEEGLLFNWNFIQLYRACQPSYTISGLMFSRSQRFRPVCICFEDSHPNQRSSQWPRYRHLDQMPYTEWVIERDFAEALVPKALLAKMIRLSADFASGGLQVQNESAYVDIQNEFLCVRKDFLRAAGTHVEPLINSFYDYWKEEQGWNLRNEVSPENIIALCQAVSTQRFYCTGGTGWFHFYPAHLPSLLRLDPATGTAETPPSNPPLVSSQPAQVTGTSTASRHVRAAWVASFSERPTLYKHTQLLEVTRLFYERSGLFMAEAGERARMLSLASPTTAHSWINLIGRTRHAAIEGDVGFMAYWSRQLENRVRTLFNQLEQPNSATPTWGMINVRQEFEHLKNLVPKPHKVQISRLPSDLKIYAIQSPEDLSIRTLLEELTMNAVDSLDIADVETCVGRPGTIYFDARRDDHGTTLSISDNGAGMGQETLRVWQGVVYEAFGACAEVGGRTTVKSIVAAHTDRIRCSVESVEGSGTVWRIFIKEQA